MMAPEPVSAGDGAFSPPSPPPVDVPEWSSAAYDNHMAAELWGLNIV